MVRICYLTDYAKPWNPSSRTYVHLFATMTTPRHIPSISHLSNLSALTAFAAIALAFAGCKSENPEKPGAGAQAPGASKPGGKPGGGKGPSALEAVIVKPEPIEATVRVPGNLGASRKVELKTETGGRVVQIAFREGASVKAGALLLRLFDDDLQAAVAKTQAKAKMAKSTVDRKRQVQAAEALSKQDLETAETDLASAEADLALAQAQLRKARVLAPFSGVVGIRSVEEGQTVSAGQSVAVISQQDPWRIVFSIPENQAGVVKVGQELTFQGGGSTDKFPARIVALDPVLDEATRSRKAIAESRAKSSSLFPGRVVDIQISLQRADGISIPSEALAFDAKGPLAWVFRGGKSMSTRIVTGLRTSDRIVVESGLRPGDTVLVVGATNLKPGGDVKVARIRNAK
jgi:membrane fusion protein (multidrug efflux system)